MWSRLVHWFLMHISLSVTRAVCAMSKQTISTLTQTERREQKGMTLLPHLLGLYTRFSCSLASLCQQSHTAQQIHLPTLLFFLPFLSYLWRVSTLHKFFDTDNQRQDTAQGERNQLI